VLLYYAIANAAAWTLEPEGRGHQVLRRKSIAFLGLVGCLVLAFLLPISSVLVGAAVVAIGAAAYAVSAPGRPGGGS
jgi:APA family basic amino acid/polyamine antiporter